MTRIEPIRSEPEMTQCKPEFEMIRTEPNPNQFIPEPIQPEQKWPKPKPIQIQIWPDSILTLSNASLSIIFYLNTMMYSYVLKSS